MHDDTIAAISTPIGAAGIGIVRISGDLAIPIADKIFKGKKNVALKDAANYRLSYGNVVDSTGIVVDEVLVSVMRRPYSFTCEDVVEINCHGGVIVLRKVLQLVLSAGARLAEAGEFSKRAFLNGRIDLAQAESIIDLINAKTDKGLSLAVNQLGGRLSSEIGDVRHGLLGLIAHIEALIDFPEDDLEDISPQGILEKTILLHDQVEVMIRSASVGKVLREGLKTVIVGKPNVGKSSLLNSLLREKRAIVTDIPGTTRDVIEEVINLRGIPLVLVDTAGIRETSDIVEKIGVEKSKEMFAEADLILLMIDVSSGFTDEDKKIMSLIEGKNYLVILNKTDLKSEGDIGEFRRIFANNVVLTMSLVSGHGVEELEKRIEDMVFTGSVAQNEGVVVSNIRHVDALERALRSLKEAWQTVEEKLPVDCIVIDLRSAWEALGEITGDSVSEDLVDRIFSEFCLGK